MERKLSEEQTKKLNIEGFRPLLNRQRYYADNVKLYVVIQDHKQVKRKMKGIFRSFAY